MDALIDDRLQTLKPWIKAMAFRTSPNPTYRDDLIQEGYIAAWRALTKVDESMPERSILAYARKAVEWGISDSHKYQHTFGQERRKPHATVTFVPVDAEEWPETAVEDSYDEDFALRAEVRLAVNELPKRQRDYVLQRFWGDAGHSELSTFGHNTWHKVKGKLRERLAHLEGAV